jgi:hypothetical protein
VDDYQNAPSIIDRDPRFNADNLMREKRMR